MTINLNNASTINNAIGTRTHWSCKPVINMTTGEVYASAKDAAEALGASYHYVTMCCLGKSKFCKGNELMYIKHTSENVDSLAASLRAMHEKMAQLEADAAVGRAIREEQEAKQKAEEERKNLLESAKEFVNKMLNKVERRQRIVERKQEELKQALSRLEEAKHELADAQATLDALNGNEMAVA